MVFLSPSVTLRRKPKTPQSHDNFIVKYLLAWEILVLYDIYVYIYKKNRTFEWNEIVSASPFYNLRRE